MKKFLSVLTSRIDQNVIFT